MRLFKIGEGFLPKYLQPPRLTPRRKGMVVFAGVVVDGVAVEVVEDIEVGWRVLVVGIIVDEISGVVDEISGVADEISGVIVETSVGSGTDPVFVSVKKGILEDVEFVLVEL